MLTNSRILAQTIYGKNSVILAQVDSLYILVLGTAVRSFFSKKTTFKILQQKVLNREEALLALEQINKLSRTKNTTGNTALLTEPTAHATGLSIVETTTHTVVHSAVHTEESLFLLGTSKVEIPETPVVSTYAPIVSPYYGEKEIFLASQMTCAPNASRK